MENEKYCPLVSCRNGGGHGISDWVKCLGNRCMFFNSEIEKCSVWMIGYGAVESVTERGVWINKK